MARRERRLTKRERKALDPQGLEDRLRSRVAARSSSDVNVDVGAIPGAPKMSDILTEWAAEILVPLRDSNIQTFRAALTFASLVWNEASDSAKTVEAVVSFVMEKMSALGPGMPPELHEAVAELTTRRREQYAAERRIVVDTEVLDEGDERRIRVASGTPGS